MIKLIACDCDGTLLNNDSELDNETVKAIERFQALGGVFMLATGRNRFDTAVVTDKVKDCVLNCDDGCALFDQDGKQLLIHKIEKDRIRKIFDLSEHYDFPVLYHGLKATYIAYDHELFKSKAIYQLKRRYSPFMSEDIFDWVFNNNSHRYGTDQQIILDEDIIKLEPILIEDKDYELICEECLSAYRDMNVIIGSFLNNIEITSKESDKAQAVKEYCRLKEIKDDEVIVIGDSGNDVSMFRLFENSYCVKNGQDIALKSARHIIDRNDELGVAKLIDKLCDEIHV